MAPRTTTGLVELFNPDATGACLVLCDHAGAQVPDELDQLGLTPRELQHHIAYDIGAAAVTYRLARELGASALLDHCSRLVIDPNRRPNTATAIPKVSDGTVVPGNRALSPAERRERMRRYHLPYHRAIARHLAGIRRSGRTPVVVAVHSFTPQLAGGLPRPWQIGVLWRDDRRLAAPVLEALLRRGDLTVGDNQPYSGLAEFGYTIEFHCQRARLPHVMLEIRQDEIADEAGAERYATIAAAALRPVLAEPEIYRPWEGPVADAQPWRRPKGLVELR
jgi:predicted N-formylglutamate amidohydrolase